METSPVSPVINSNWKQFSQIIFIQFVLFLVGVCTSLLLLVYFVHKRALVFLTGSWCWSSTFRTAKCSAAPASVFNFKISRFFAEILISIKQCRDCCYFNCSKFMNPNEEKTFHEIDLIDRSEICAAFHACFSRKEDTEMKTWPRYEMERVFRMKQGNYWLLLCLFQLAVHAARVYLFSFAC